MHYRSFLNRDYKSRTESGKHRRRPEGHWRLRALAFVAGSAVIGAVLAATHDSTKTVADAPIAELKVAHDSGIPAIGERLTIALPLPAFSDTRNGDASAAVSMQQPAQWETVTVKRGDTLSSIFSDLEMYSQLRPILALGETVKPLTSIHPGQTFRIQRDTDGRLAELVYDLSDLESLRIWRNESGMQAEQVVREVEIRQAHATGTIRSSLFEAGLGAGMSENLIMELATIFGWDIDFVLDIREGDQFSVVFEEYYRDGEKLRDGKILAAEFVNQGSTYRAAYFDGEGVRAGYYSPEGHSMRKAFLRAPVDFHRISSGFQRARVHPVTGNVRAHKGVDYAAPTGTPIRSAGDGKIVFRGVKGGYGNVVIVQHGATYSTLYAHMSRFKGGLSVGSRVKQGQIIGYVGQTGLATGPHLHYEFRVNGVHRNPLTIKLPTAEPLPAERLATFQHQSAPLFAQLDVVKRVQLAQAQNP